MMGSKTNHDAIAAELLWRMRATAAKEVQDDSIKDTIVSDEIKILAFREPSTSSLSRKEHSVAKDLTVPCDAGQESPISSQGRVDMVVVPNRTFSSLVLFDLACPGTTLPPLTTGNKGAVLLDHFDWTNRATSCDFKPSTSFSLLTATDTLSLSPDVGPPKKMDPSRRAPVRQKWQSFVGQTSSNIVRATLRKKFSWKQYPELEEYLRSHQEEYFMYSARNYSADQRKYNNALTRGLLEVAAKEGYIFEEFTFPMVRDRIRCYFKSHAQAAKKKDRKGDTP